MTKKEAGDAYKRAGVNIDAATKAVEMMKKHVVSTHDGRVLHIPGSFGGIYDVSFLKRYKNPVLVASTDGVGTKVEVARRAKQYTVGQDIVNHCVNDILAQGVTRPMFFLDYLAADKLLPEEMTEIVANMAIACRENGVSLIGGETAEMPGTYQMDSKDIAGFIVGAMERKNVIDGSAIAEGDVLVGIASNGLHTNGYSLARRAFFETGGYDINTYLSGPKGPTIGEELLKIHLSYLKPVRAVLRSDKVNVRGIAHITGGGFPDNIGRLIRKDGLCAKISRNWKVPEVFRMIQMIEKVSEEEMYRTFNMGIGMVLIVPANESGFCQDIIFQNSEFTTFVIGKIARTKAKKKVIMK